jgi:hypothetical protein
LRAEDIEELFDQADDDREGRIGLVEFRNWWLKA